MSKVQAIPGASITPDMVIAELVGEQDSIESIAVVVRDKAGDLGTFQSSMKATDLALAAAVMQAEAVESTRDGD